jgi:hypothetical protein
MSVVTPDLPRTLSHAMILMANLISFMLGVSSSWFSVSLHGNSSNTVSSISLGNKTPHIDKQYGEIKIGRMG